MGNILAGLLGATACVLVGGEGGGEMTICEHCGYDISIRNPSGFCDHLYYPNNCSICKQQEKVKSYFREKCLLAISDVHSGNRAEGEKIVDIILGLIGTRRIFGPLDIKGFELMSKINDGIDRNISDQVCENRSGGEK